MIRVLLLDNDELLRDSIAHLLDAQEDMIVAAAASTDIDLDRICEESSPDVVIVDPAGAAAEVADWALVLDQLRGKHRVLVLSELDTADALAVAIRRGIAGYLLKDCGTDDLLAALRTVAAGGGALAPSLIRMLIDRCSFPDGRQRDVAARYRLTGRELDVLLELRSGSTNAEIGDRLGVGPATVKSHVSRLLTKIGGRSRLEAVVFAYEHGLTPAWWSGTLDPGGSEAEARRRRTDSQHRQ